ncbi:MAG: NAD-dependent epimerase/dehydratase family protein, partial [Bdellovibrionales bacterium]|nr:NAD-dependent epimerase/dehydratase family protein [Bdellovibrionales bacterium]
MAKVMVTGGAGFIGSHIVDILLQAGHQVAVLDDLSSGKLENLPSGQKLYRLDIRDQTISDAFQEFEADVVVHAAAQISVRVSMENPYLDAHVNVAGIAHILQQFPRERLPYVVFISTGGALYGEQDEFPASEDHPIRPTSVYGQSKYCSELFLDLWRREFGLEYAALRLGNVYGPRQNPHGEAGVVAIFCERMLHNQEVLINGSGQQTRDFVYVADVANAVKEVVQRRVSGVFNIGTGKECSVNHIFEILCKDMQLD